MTSKRAKPSATPETAHETTMDDQAPKNLAEPVDTSHSPPQGPVSRDTGGGAGRGPDSAGLLAA